MVWIHGGGWHFSSGNRDVNGPDYFMDEDVILVTMNYRLGALGEFISRYFSVVLFMKQPEAPEACSVTNLEKVQISGVTCPLRAPRQLLQLQERMLLS
jgi:hypothetical protein